ncbi:MAG: glutathione S-transferase N-terminal domain-containing protein, partial [Rudaea sp.]
MSAKPVLVVGSKNYSSWSLRPWLLLRHYAVAFDEIVLPLDTPEFHERIRNYSPTGRVPVLHDGAVRVWDSLAIAEYANERWLGGRGWPAAAAARALARAISAEMHSGFAALRSELP